MKRVLSVFLCAVIFVGIGVLKTEALGTSAEAHVLLDADNGIVLSENNKDKKMKMASTTKIMTALIALEYAAKDNKTVTFTKDMVAEGSSMYLRIGDKVKLTDLAAGMMMASGNDAANAIALTISGSFEEFAELMNERADKIGMKNTNFVTPSGLDDDNHYSTAFDMALLMAEAMNNQSFLSLSSASEKTVNFVYPEDKVSVYQNHNRLLKMYKSCTGGKTGFTKAAGRCLVTSAEKDGIRLIAVTLNAPDDWNDHISLYEYGFSSYLTADFDDRNMVFEIPLTGSEESFVTASVDEAMAFKVPANRIKDIEKNIFLPQFVFAPVNEGDIVGKITYTLDGRELAKTYIRANSTVMEKKQKGFFSRLFSLIFNRE